MSTEAKCQRLWDTFWQHSEHSLSRSQQSGFASVCLSMADQAMLFSLNPPCPHRAHVHLHSSSPCFFFCFWYFYWTFARVCMKGEEDPACLDFLENLRFFRKSKQAFSEFTSTSNHSGSKSSSQHPENETNQLSVLTWFFFSPNWWWLSPLHVTARMPTCSLKHLIWSNSLESHQIDAVSWAILMGRGFMFFVQSVSGASHLGCLTRSTN